MSTNRSHSQLPRAQVAEFCQRRHTGTLAVFGTQSYVVARDKLRDWLLSLRIVHQAPGKAFGDVLKQYREWLTA
jgi:hypothetical protein